MSMQPFEGGLPAVPAGPGVEPVGDGFEPFDGEAPERAPERTPDREDDGRFRRGRPDPVRFRPRDDDGTDDAEDGRGCDCAHEPGCPYGERPGLFARLTGRRR